MAVDVYLARELAEQHIGDLRHAARRTRVAGQHPRRVRASLGGRLVAWGTRLEHGPQCGQCSPAGA